MGDSEVRALDGVTVSFEAERYTAIMGPSGSGKSTLMHCLAGLDTLTSGAVYIGDTYLAKLNDKQLTELRRSKVGFVFQAYNLIPTLTAEENITAAAACSAASDGDQAWIDQVVTHGRPERPAEAPPERAVRRPAAARRRGPGAGQPPEIIFADEPTGNLDSRSGAEILEFMRRAVREYGQTIVMVTHDPARRRTPTGSCSSTTAVVDEMTEPTAERVLDRMKQLGD